MKASTSFKSGDRVMVSARHLRALGTQRFGGGNAGVSTHCRGRGSFIGYAPGVEFIGYVLWDDDEINGIARGINVGNLVHIRDLHREADAAQHAPERGYISPENGQGMGVPTRCTLHPCDGAIKRTGKFYECETCGASYGND